MKYEKVKITDRDITSDGIIQLINKIQKAAHKNRNLLLDFHEVNLLNSGAIGVLIRSHKDLQIEKGGLAVIGVSEQLETILDNSGLYKIIPAFKHVEEYEAYLEKHL